MCCSTCTMYKLVRVRSTTDVRARTAVRVRTCTNLACTKLVRARTRPCTRLVQVRARSDELLVQAYTPRPSTTTHHAARRRRRRRARRCSRRVKPAVDAGGAPPAPPVGRPRPRARSASAQLCPPPARDPFGCRPIAAKPSSICAARWVGGCLSLFVRVLVSRAPRQGGRAARARARAHHPRDHRLHA